MHHYLLAAVCERASPEEVKNKVSNQREYRSAHPMMQTPSLILFRIHNTKCIVLYSKAHDAISFIRIFIIPPSVATYMGRWHLSCRNVIERKGTCKMVFVLAQRSRSHYSALFDWSRGRICSIVDNINQRGQVFADARASRGQSWNQ